MKNNFRQDIDYWNHKVKAFLHDPPDKAIQIPGHEGRANRLLDTLGIQSSLDPQEFKEADIIASGMDRVVLPGYSSDPLKNGAIAFCDNPLITHPTGTDGKLSLSLPISNPKTLLKQVESGMVEVLNEDLGQFSDGNGLSERPLYKENEAAFAPARFHYLFFLLRRRLAEKNIGGLGGLWYRMPADTRIPDHSIWQHSGLVSALASCFRLSAKNRASLMVFAITPVQDFVGRARKLRDYWSGSILLSWLAFEGIKSVILELGADHILYPSLHGQPLIDDLLRDQWQMDELVGNRNHRHGVASFPNKFVCLVPAGMEQEIASHIEQAIQDRWLELGCATRKKVEKLVGQDAYVKEQFDRQIGSYWEYSWAATPLVGKQNHNALAELLPQEPIQTLFEFVQDGDRLLASENISGGSGRGVLYGASHRLAQTMLAAGKTYRTNQRKKEPGIKCDMFGEFEALRFGFKEGDDRNPPPTQDPFWQALKEKWNPTSDFGKSERLCAIGLVKRLAYRVCQSIDNHPLKKMFKDADTFPSTTEMALHDWYGQLKNKALDDSNLAAELSEFTGNRKAQLAQWFHEINEPEQIKRTGREIMDTEERQRRAAREILRKHHKVKDMHKYYALLMMDGDKMGSLVNGETMGAHWKSVLHPDLVRRMDNGFDEKYKKFWHKHFASIRQVSPAVHAAVSESLGDFSLLSVPEIIEQYNGRLIYAGGDDVCAIMPVSTVLEAAREIAESYCRGFVFVDEQGRISFPDGCWNPQPGKLAVYLGKGEKISISAGIMIAHHKKPLSRVINRAHQLLDMAKQEGGRNGFCLELDKRSGGGRIFMGGWQEQIGSMTVLEHFMETARALQKSKKSPMSASLAYRLADFEDGILPLLDREELLCRFIEKQLDRSGLAEAQPKEKRKERLQETAAHVAALLAYRDKGRKATSLQAESLVIANFMGHCLAEKESA